MSINRQLFEDLVFKNYDRTMVRFLQNSPIYPSVWLSYGFGETKKKSMGAYRADLILTPDNKSSAAELFRVLYHQRSGDSYLSWELATNGETVAAKLTFSELIHDVLPLTGWWKKVWFTESKKHVREQEWLRLVIGAVLAATRANIKINALSENALKTLDRLGKTFIASLVKEDNTIAEDVLWSASLNRTATISLFYSVPCTKADAGRRLFDITGSDITWAVVDSGIDAKHPAFRKIDPATKKILLPAMGNESDPFVANRTRVVATYDFTRFRSLISTMVNNRNAKKVFSGMPTSDKHNRTLAATEKDAYFTQIEEALKAGRMLDWTVLGPLLRIPHNESQYISPKHPHGTHVAGIIGAGLVEGAGDVVLVGMCPQINLYDFRVMDSDGRGDEFNIIAALQFIRWINQHDGLNIHGANLSMSIPHEVETYACGQTPVCVSVNRLVEEGLVVVAAAGNQGQSVYQSDTGIQTQGFRTVNITDPGNAEDVITVGATHRNEPHRYGVAYFSSKGPTGDGRVKPDLVAPGEKIYSSVLNEGIDAMDGTSMAAPHVSGAAALVMAKHRELMGRPRKIKEILCRTATDLGRDRYFQGCGMIDVLRAIQSV